MGRKRGGRGGGRGRGRSGGGGGGGGRGGGGARRKSSSRPPAAAPASSDAPPSRPRSRPRGRDVGGDESVGGGGSGSGRLGGGRRARGGGRRPAGDGGVRRGGGRRDDDEEEAAEEEAAAAEDPPASDDVDLLDLGEISGRGDREGGGRRDVADRAVADDCDRDRGRDRARDDGGVSRADSPRRRPRPQPSYSYSSDESDASRGGDLGGRARADRSDRRGDDAFARRDHAFAQFQIRPLRSAERNCDGSDDDEEEDEDEEDEEAPLFFAPSDNFDSATDARSSDRARGVGWGADCPSSRARRKEEERRHRFEIERREEGRGGKLWRRRGRDDEGWDDVDFDRRPSRRRRAGRCLALAAVAAIVAAAIVAAAAVAASQRGKVGGGAAGPEGAADLPPPARGGAVPSSRWGRRFDDDDDSALEGGAEGIDYVVDSRSGQRGPKYRRHGHKNRTEPRTPEDREREEGEREGEWEEYEAEVASVLADARPGWDVNAKHGGKADEEEDEGEGRGDNDYDNGYASDAYDDRWIRYYDKSTRMYYYFHRETNATQWEKPRVEAGTVLLGIAYGTGREYVLEDGGAAEAAEEEEEAPPSFVSAMEVGPPVEVAIAEFEDFPRAREVLDHYKDTFWRWNHPYRIPESTETWGGIDAPVFWRVPLSGATTVEEALTHCFHMIVAGTTGTNADGKAVRKHNISEHLSVITLDDGAHYLNIDMNTKEGVQKARTAGLGRSGVADVILTRFIYNAAELFKDTGHTGRCFTLLRHPIDRAVAVFHTLKRNKVRSVSGMSLTQYANSTFAEENWMTRMITNSMEGKVTREHLKVAKEVLGRKCLVGFLEKIGDSLGRFAKFFRWEEIKSVNTHHSVVESEEKDLESKRRCLESFVEYGVNRHEYARIDKASEAWKFLREKNKLDIELYEFAEAMYYKQSVVYKDKG
ncbi:hypothetical protein ACHAWF_005069 [Thalassiosira exigua]